MTKKSWFLLALLLSLTARLAAQQPDPSARYQTAQTEHFRITYTPELAHLVQLAANRAEEAYRILAQELVRPPKGVIDLVLTDVADISNGYATPLPSNRIVVFAKPPVDDQGLQHYTEWFDLVITHELAHIFHLDQAGRIGRVLRTVFGRVPFEWPFFPVLGMPSWNLEGLAVEFESRATRSGRQHGSYHEMIVRTALLEDRVDPIDRVSGDTPLWPGPQRVYIYGALFNDYLSRKYGPAAQREIIEKTAGTIIPTSLNVNRIGRRALGRHFTDAYNDWIAELRARYGALADSLRAAGLTRSERITTEGRYALYPRISNDGTRLSYSAEVGHEVMMTRVIELPGGRTLWSQRRNGDAPADFTPGNALVTTQYDFTNRYELRTDVVRLRDGGEDRLTRGARVQEIDVDRTGNKLVAVELHPGSSRLVQLDANGRMTRPITPASQGTDWSLPRWSPDGTRIAASRWQQGGKYDLVVLDTAGNVVRQITDDEAIDAGAAWSPDGRYVVFCSDRTGIANLYAFDLQSSQLRQVTNVLGGAFHPDVTPDGRWIYFSAYYADGYHIERIPFAPQTWRVPGPMRLASALRPRAALDSAAVVSVQAPVSEPRGYSALTTLRPYFWLPFGSSGEVIGDFIGAATAGADVLNRHSYYVGYAREFEQKRDEGYLGYSFNGLRNPSLSLYLARDWDSDSLTFRRPNGTTGRVAMLEREDLASLSATFLRRRIRSSLSVAVGGEAVRRRRMVLDSPNVRFTDAVDVLYGPAVRIGFANYRSPAYAISRENGIGLSAGARIRREQEVVQRDRGYSEVNTWNTAYRSLGKLGFAHHVLAARFSGIARSGAGLSLVELGGVPGTLFDFGFGLVGEGNSYLPVRGYPEEARLGSRGWSASLEYRVPLAMIGRGRRLWPVFLDRTYASAFFDAGNTSCDTETRGRFTAEGALRICGPTTGRDPLMSAGAELAANIALLSFSTIRTRVGYGQPLNEGRSGRFYISFGPAF